MHLHNEASQEFHSMLKLRLWQHCMGSQKMITNMAMACCELLSHCAEDIRYIVYRGWSSVNCRVEYFAGP